MIMKYGNINNTERKFISTNIVYLNNYLERLEIIEDVNIIQTFYKGYKYRKYITSNGYEYTKNLKVNNITIVNKIDEKEFNKILCITKKCIKKRRRTYIDNNYQIDVDDFLVPNKFTMVEVSNGNLDEYKIPKGLVDVTNISGYQNKEIYNGFIKKVGIIIEGTDAVGKSLTLNELLKEGIVCKDRDSKVISANMLFTIPMNERAKKYEYFLMNSEDILLFLINNDKEELLRRVYSRKNISDFDLDTYEYNKLYKKTYEYMRNNNMLHGKLHCVDCTGLDINNQLVKVKKIIDRYAKY